MIPKQIIEYLHASGAPFRKHPHARAVTAQELAAAVHITGNRVAKAVIVRAGDRRCIAVLPATERLDEQLLARALRAKSVEMMAEEEFKELFPGCEVGAEPPFGGLYGMHVVVDASFEDGGVIIFRAGSHEEAIEMQFEDFVRLEHPDIAPIGRKMGAAMTMHA